MMKDFKALTEERQSVRGYTPERISRETLDYILECGRMAPSAVNRQPWKIRILTPDTSTEKWEAIHRCYHREWFETAPYVLVCSILHEASWKRAQDEKDHGDIDIAILAEHLCLAATEQGIGTCWVCNFDASLCKEALSMPDNEEPAVLIPMGYAAQKKLRPKDRKAISEIVEIL